MAKPKSTSGVISSVDHAVDLIEMLSVHGTATVSEIARTTGLPRPTVYRLLRTLAARKITGMDGKRHHLTLRLHELGVRARSVDMFQQRVQPILDRIVAATGLTAHLAVRDGNTAAFVAKRDGPEAMPMASRIGWRGPLHCTAVGKVLLAEDDSQPELPLVRQTNQTIVDPSLLAKALEDVRRDGYALDDEELLPGLRCVAVPWRDGEALIGAISVSGRSDEVADPAGLAEVLRNNLG
ncbi:IclR family transcriptional regulator [Nisaea sediminum]|uniref:IclR family transcriptional regulator n=1 Tax=Nisaea sediminum TaxID=2775867 RepID=UPI0018669E78|nr:IclR family transcriptional regulator [Nisaea sediminum]